MKTLTTFVKVKIYYAVRQIVKVLFHWNVFKESEINACQSIAVLCGAGIGDAVMAIPIVEMIKLYNNKIKITVITNKLNAEIFKFHPFISKQIIYNSTFHSLLKSYFVISYINYDVFIGSQPSNTIAHSLFAFFSFAKRRIKISSSKSIFKYRDYDFLYDILICDNKARHRIELNLDIARSVGISNYESEEFICEIYTPQLRSNKHIQSNWRTEYVLIHLGGGRKEKIWDVVNYSKIINHLLKKNNTVIIVGGVEEQFFMTKIKINNFQKIINLIGKLKLSEIQLLLHQSKLLITNDTGIMHLATTTNVKIIALFGDTAPSHIGPYTNKAVVIKKDNVKNILIEEVIILIDRCLE